MKNLFFALAVAVFGLSSCDMSIPKVEPTPAEINYFSEFNIGQVVFNDVVSEVMKYTKFRINNPTESADDKGVIVSNIEAGNVMTIEYPSDLSENPRRGKIRVTFNQNPSVWPLVKDISMQIEPVGLTYSGMKVAGDIGIVVLEKGTTKEKLNISVAGGSITDIYNASIYYRCNFISEQNEGEKVNYDSDDTITYTGTSNGKFADGKTYNMTIEEPLVKNYGSSSFKSGKLSMTPSMYSEPFFITFGKGEYANQVLLTYKGESKLYYI